jgi:hypothetical protein
MNVKLKLAAYVILAALAIWFLREFRISYSHIGQPAAGPATNTAPRPPARPKPRATNQIAALPAPGIVTNQTTNDAAGTNTDAGSNTVQQPAAPDTLPTGQQPAAPDTPPTNTASGNSAEEAAPPGTGPAPAASEGQGKTVAYLAALVGAVIGLGVLIAYDVTHYIGSRATSYLFSDLGEGMRDPEYERAEQTWVNGQPLEAIEMMREYLNKNPRELFVALRIAEIYEKDLHNYVAASLEYEDVLRKRLPPEGWGRAAIHLCNIYSRMGKQDKMKELLERIARDYPKTGAAKKARQTLGLPEPQEEAKEAPPAAEQPESAMGESYSTGKVFDLDEMIAAADEETVAPPPQATPETPLPAKPPKTKLPPGFRKKE